MWILPKQLHTSAFVPDTAALISDLNAQSQICAQSLFVRSKPSQLATWLRKWKRDSWTALLSGRILKPSHGKSFLDAWTSSLGATPASKQGRSSSQGAASSRLRMFKLEPRYSPTVGGGEWSTSSNPSRLSQECSSVASGKSDAPQTIDSIASGRNLGSILPQIGSQSQGWIVKTLSGQSLLLSPPKGVSGCGLSGDTLRTVTSLTEEAVWTLVELYSPSQTTRQKSSEIGYPLQDSTHGKTPDQGASSSMLQETISTECAEPMAVLVATSTSPLLILDWTVVGHESYSVDIYLVMGSTVGAQPPVKNSPSVWSILAIGQASMSASDSNTKIQNTRSSEGKSISQITGLLTSTTQPDQGTWMEITYGGSSNLTTLQEELRSTILELKKTRASMQTVPSSTIASHSVPLESDSEKMTQDTCGPSSQTELNFSNPELASSKTLTDMSRWDSTQSSVIWKNLVTKRRGEFLARLKSVRLTNASGSSSLESCPQTVASYKDANWPTVRAQEPGTTSPGYGRGLAATVEEKYKQWPTISVNEAKDGGHSQEQRNSVPLGTLAGLLDPTSPNTHGNPQESFSEFQTPKTGDCKATIHFPKREGGGQPNLAYDVEKNGWRTPNVCDVTGGSKSAEGVLANNGMLKLQGQVKPPSKKLNPRWVESLMGVQFGWVSPFPVEEETNTNRIDELRLLGNGVVPGTALKAFTTLIKQNHDNRT